jgi:outer membrane protein
LLTTISAVEQAYFEWIAARESVRVQEEAVSLARQQASEFAMRVRIGVAQQLDEQRLSSQAARSEADLLEARRNLRQREIAVVNLITTKYEDWRGYALQPSDELPTQPRNFDAQASWTKAFEHRPDLHQFIIDLERLGLTEKLQYNQLFPTLDLTGNYGYNGFGDSLRGTFGDISDANKPAWSVGLIASFPIGNRTAKARLRGTKLEKDQANERLKQARQSIMVEVENAIIAARTDWERIPATRVAREYAASALEAGRVRLASGVATSLEILTLQRDLTAARSDEIRALVDYNKAITVLLQREGMLLEERGLTVNVQ